MHLAGPIVGGNRRTQWPKKGAMLAYVAGRSGLVQNQIKMKSNPNTNSPRSTLRKRLTETRERTVPPVYEEHLRFIISSLAPKNGNVRLTYFFAVSSSVVRLVAGKNAMEILHKSQRIFNRRFWPPGDGARRRF